MKKIVAVIAAVVVLLSSMSFLVSANDSEHLRLKKVMCFDKNSNTWIDRTNGSSWFKSGDNYMLSVTNPQSQYSYYGLWVTWTAAPYMRLEYGQVLDVDISFWDYVSASDAVDGLKADYLRISFTDNTYVDVPSASFTYDSSNNKWNIRYLVTLDNVVESVLIESIEFRTEIPSYNSGSYAYSVRVNSTFRAVDSPELKQHKELISAIGDVSDRIITNQNANTDRIVNGWGSDDNSAGKADTMTGDMTNAENSALGGKSDAQIKNEVAGALDYNMPSESLVGAVKVADAFDKLLQAFGGKYQSLLILALTLGLAAFLVGRSYRAKGD